MDISYEHQIISSVDTDCENFVSNRDWHAGSETTLAASEPNILDMLCDNLELDNEFSQFQCLKIQIETRLQSQTNTEKIEMGSFMNEKYSNNSYSKSQQISSIAFLPEQGFQFPLKACQDSNTIGNLAYPSQSQANINNPVSFNKKENNKVELQNQANKWRAEIENFRNDNYNTDPLQNTKGASCVVSVPMYDISFSIEGYQDANPQARAKESEYKGKKNAVERSKNRPRYAGKNRSSFPQERVKRLKEINTEAARAYRKRKRIQDQEFEAKLELLKNIALGEISLEDFKDLIRLRENFPLSGI
jgi:hypothetical protein